MEKYLYHYTDSNALINILTEGKLRASHFGYMNDGQELLYYIANYLNPLTIDYINKKALDYDTFKSFKEHYRINNPFFEPYSFNLFLTSFSEEGNDLSMWRGYTPNGGYSIGFEISDLEKLVDGNDSFCKCEYVDKFANKQSAQDFVENIFRSGFIPAQLSKGTSDSFQHVVNYLNKIYAFEAIRKKNIEFKHEKEWRLSYNLKANDERIKFRSKGQLVIPYFEIDLTKFVKKVEIYIGPGPYNKMQYSYMSYLAFKSKFQVNISGTNHNYRII